MKKQSVPFFPPNSHLHAFYSDNTHQCVRQHQRLHTFTYSLSLSLSSLSLSFSLTRDQVVRLYSIISFPLLLSSAIVHILKSSPFLPLTNYFSHSINHHTHPVSWCAEPPSFPFHQVYADGCLEPIRQDLRRGSLKSYFVPTQPVRTSKSSGGVWPEVQSKWITTGEWSRQRCGRNTGHLTKDSLTREGRRSRFK